MPIRTSTTPNGTGSTIYDVFVDIVIDSLRAARRVRGPLLDCTTLRTYKASLRGTVATVGAQGVVDNYPISNPSTIPNTPAARLNRAFGNPDRQIMFSIPDTGGSEVSATLGTMAGTLQVGAFADGAFDDGSGFKFASRYRLYVPAPGKFENCCIEADCGAPWGTLRFIYTNGSVFVSPVSPPSSWTLTGDTRGTGDIVSNFSYKVRKLGNRALCSMWPGVSGDNGRNMGWTTERFPSQIYFGTRTYSGITGYNYQTSTPVRTNCTAVMQWFSVDHSNIGSPYGALPGAALSAPFSIPYTDLTPTGTGPTFKFALNQTLPQPAFTNSAYNGLFLRILYSCDSVDAGGTPYVSSFGGDVLIITDSMNRNYSSNIYWNTLAAPVYYPWDVVGNSYGPDDSTVRWVRHVGYIPPDSEIQPEIAQTTFPMILSRIGKLIILQGGYQREALPPATYILPATSLISGISVSTDPTLQNQTEVAAGGGSMRIVSVSGNAEWSTQVAVSFGQEGPPLYKYRVTYQNRYNDGTTIYEGPGILLNDVILLTSSVNGVAGNTAIVATYSSGSPTVLANFGLGFRGGDISAPATAGIQIVAQPSSFSELTLIDALGVTKIFSYNPSPGPGKIPVASGVSINGAVANTIAAINASGLSMVASIHPLTDLKAEITLCRRRYQSGGYNFTTDLFTSPVP